ncbi:MAG: hypothetical protein RLN81_10540 [Balneolaceae bacterium]
MRQQIVRFWGLTNSRKLLFLFLFVFITTKVSAQQSDKDILNTKLSQYFDLLSNENYVEMMDYVYPKVFTIVPKEEMIKAFEEVLDGMKFAFSDMEIQWIEPVFSEDFQLVKYLSRIEIVLISEDVKSSIVLNSMAAYFENEDGFSNLEVDTDNFKISGNMGKYILAISEDEYPGWYFMEFDQDNPQLLNLLLSSDLIESVKKRISAEK